MSKISERTLRTRDMIRTDNKWVDIFSKIPYSLSLWQIGSSEICLFEIMYTQTEQCITL